MTSNISIITTVRNGANTISDCLSSVGHQTVPVEHVIIDGLSSDGTVDIINGGKTANAIFISEADTGFYDAINKGLKMASGDVIGILNADDVYSHDRVLEKVADCFSDPAVDSCYGDLVYVNSSDTSKVHRYWRSGAYHPKRFFWGWMPPHPTFFVRREIYKKYGGFNLSLGTAADYELMLRFLLKHRITSKYIPEVLVKMRVGGLSNATISARLKAHRMDRRAWSVNGLKPHPWTLLLKPLSKIGQFFAQN
jgi:glycosyltransferase